MNRSDSIAEATRRFIEADRKHAVARAKAASTEKALQRLGDNYARFRATRAAA